MRENNDVLKSVWTKDKESELGLNSLENKTNERLSKLLYYTLGAITDYLCRIDETTNIETEIRLQFSAKYLELLKSITNDKNIFNGDAQISLFSAVSYYFADFEGAAMVAVKNIKIGKLSSIQKMLLDVLRVSNNSFNSNSKLCTLLHESLLGNGPLELMDSYLGELVDNTYRSGNDMDIIAVECLKQMVKLKLSTATMELMPRYSSSNHQYWQSLVKKGKLKELLWPSQRKLGENGIFLGDSAVVQMPTGAGKTASISLIIRSTLYRNNLTTIIVVAPFKSIRDEIFSKLCREFADESISFTKSSDDLIFDLGISSTKSSIVVVTPEKLLFLIRQSQGILSNVDLIIFDEAHQLDNHDRGITFELLLTTISELVPEDVQKIFISAVIGNPDTISDWFNSGNNVEISGIKQKKYSRSYGIAGWNKENDSGTLLLANDIKFSNPWIRFDDVIQKIKVTPRRIEPNFIRKQKSTTKQWVTTLFAEKLISAGMVAVYSPRKDSIRNLAKCFLELTNVRNSFSNQLRNNDYDYRSTNSLATLFSKNFGDKSVLVRSFYKGIFIHDAEIPSGIRNALEYEASQGHIKLLLCTSTLAQGVNLPIKSMLITSKGYGNLKLNNRSLRNLIGRVGRPGIENDGNVIFMAYGNVHENKETQKAIISNINRERVEDLGSSILNLFRDTPIDEYNYQSAVITTSMWFRADFLKNPVMWIKANLSNVNPNLKSVFQIKADAISKIENFLMATWDLLNDGDPEENLIHVVEKTYAYAIGSDDDKKLIMELFMNLYKKIVILDLGNEKIKEYSKMMIGVNDAIDIENFVEVNINDSIESDDIVQVLKDIWPVLEQKLDQSDANVLNLYYQFAKMWIMGESYVEMVNMWNKYPDIRIGNRKPSVELVFHICDQILQYDLSMQVSSILELVSDESKKKRLTNLHESMKLGLPNQTEKNLYRLGLNDRYLVKSIADIIGKDNLGEKRVKEWIRTPENQFSVKENLKESLPNYYINILEHI
ncbi:DEAD/DEAH box helicase [Lapidilactobacillus mulanensis]|uniref:DEAD/DEAH box helicase n=1 Tax=Lapidilactobacillus mulanensis TaxID=2485999 RepID=A0ABW4DN67_9LACO|nr:DEAD/DEAH box helicase [Lapidilactobacillus mulanensis]